MEIQTKQQINQSIKTKKHKKIKNTFSMIALITLLGIIIWFGVEFYGTYNNPTLEGEWVSEETGQTVEFMDNGHILVDYIETGSYIIISPNIMEYTIEGQKFNMYYKLEQRNLIWGVDGEENERFERKQQWFDLGLDISF